MSQPVSIMRMKIKSSLHGDKDLLLKDEIRCLVGRRLVYRGVYEERGVLVKVFLQHRKQERDFQREHNAAIFLRNGRRERSRGL